MHKRPPPPLPLLLAELTWASWETVLRRSMMVALGTCSDAEYRRMITEKMNAVHQSSRLALWPGIGGDPADMVRPWHRAATRNARRLRRKP